MADLVQVVNLTVPEAAGIRGFTHTTDDGKHYIELVKETGTCDACPHDNEEAQLVKHDDGYRINQQTVYRIKGNTRTGHLCRDHLKQQPTHIALLDDIPRPCGADTA